MKRSDGSLASSCAQAIRAAILEGTIAPGEVLRQMQLAAQLGVSHIPLREGLRILETQGFLTHLPNVGYTVNELSVQEFKEIYLMRQLLETEVVRALPVFDTDVLQDLRKTNSLMKEALNRGDTLSATQMNKEFHLAMFRQSRSQLIFREVERLWGMFDPYRRMYLWKARSLECIVQEHDEMIDAALRPDRTRLIRLMDQHRNRAYEVLSSALSKATEGLERVDVRSASRNIRRVVI